MKHRYLIGTAAAAFLATGQAIAACADRLEDMEVRLEEEAERSMATSSGGQGVAGAREAQAEQLVDEGEAEEEVPTAPYQEVDEEEEAVEEAAEAGEGGRQVLEARALLEEARTHKEAGDEEACEATLDQIAELLEEEPTDAEDPPADAGADEDDDDNDDREQPRADS